MSPKNQTYLFESGKTLARKTDPPESKKAAAEIIVKIPKLQADVLEMVRRYPDRTTNELAQIFDMRDPRKIGRRLPELAADLRVVKTGSRKCNVTGKTAATWHVWCDRCEGTGNVLVAYHKETWTGPEESVMEPCPKCEGPQRRKTS